MSTIPQPKIWIYQNDICDLHTSVKRVSSYYMKSLLFPARTAAALLIVRNELLAKDQLSFQFHLREFR
jgi:hypothetical protein